MVMRPLFEAGQQDRVSSSASIVSGGHHDEVEAFDVLQQIVEGREAFGFVAAAFPDGEQSGQPSPGHPVLRIGQDVRRAVGENEARAGSDLEFRFLFAVSFVLMGSSMRAHDAGHRVPVGNAKAGQAQFYGVLDQLLRMRAAAQEGEIRGDGEFGISGCRRI